MRVEALTDEQLAIQAAGGEQQAIGALFERYFDRVYDLALGMVRNPETAADIAQTTFLKLMEHLRRSSPPQNFRAWLYTIARNTAMDEFRRSKRLAPAPVMITNEGDELPFEPEAPAQWAEPEQVVGDEETVRLVWDASAGLNPDDHALLDLHLRKGLEAAEIAAVIGSTAGAVYTRLSRLRDALEASVTALLLYRRRRDCEELDALVARYAEPELTPRLRKAINRHLDECGDCQRSRKGLLTAGALFSAVPVFLAPAPARAAALSAVLSEAAGPGEASGEASSEPGSPGQGRPAQGGLGASAARGALQGAAWAKAALGAAAAAALFATGWWTGVAWQGQPAVSPAGESPPAGSAPGSATPGASAPGAPDSSAPVVSTPGAPGTATPALLDTTPPEALHDLSSSSHAVGERSAAPHITLTWTPAVDSEPGSGLAGYLAAWDRSDTHDPTAMTLGPDAREVTSPALEPGEWWFVIRPVDRAGNVGPAARLGPFVIAAPRPENGQVRSERVTAPSLAEPAPAEPAPTEPAPAEPAPAEPAPGTRP